MKRGYWLANFSLLVFWIALIIAGIIKPKWQMSDHQIPFSTMMLQLMPFLIAFVIAGTFLMNGLLMVIYPLVKNQLSCYFKQPVKNKIQSNKKLEPAFNFNN